MPGFAFLYNTSSKFTNKPNLVCDQIIDHNFQLYRFTLNKFLNDKLFLQDTNGIIVIEGVILNKLKLIKTYDNAAWSDVVWKLYQDYGSDFFKIFRGSFSGLLYDKSKSKWIIFTDHLATKRLYYYQKDQVFVISSEIRDIYDYLRQENIESRLNINAAYMLLSYGFMLENNTLCEDIKKLMPGTFLAIQDGHSEMKQYHKLPKSSFNKNFNEAEIVETLNEKFQQVVELQFEKDREYNYNHFVSLSGGLDSRMVSWVAHELGYTKQINFTFSQSDYLDETTPKKIASDLKHEWIFKALDNGLFLMDLDEIVLLTGGISLYIGLAHSNSLFKLINFDHLGLIHSGHLAEVLKGQIINDMRYFAKTTFPRKIPEILAPPYSERFVDHVKTKPVHFSDFAELELSFLYQRGFNGTNAGHLSGQSYSEVLTPFCNIDFLEYTLSIPINARANHNIFKKWMMKKYPRAAEYVWEDTKQKFNKKTIYITVGDKRIPTSQIHSSILRKLGLKRKPIETRFNMNPFDYWYATNGDLKNFSDRYFAENIQRLDSFSELGDICRELYDTGTATEKNQVLTLLSAVKLYSMK
jgi:asparagine synthase (glutamine-hydrolysing)